MTGWENQVQPLMVTHQTPTPTCAGASLGKHRELLAGDLPRADPDGLGPDHGQAHGTQRAARPIRPRPRHNGAGWRWMKTGNGVRSRWSVTPSTCRLVTASRQFSDSKNKAAVVPGRRSESVGPPGTGPRCFPAGPKLVNLMVALGQVGLEPDATHEKRHGQVPVVAPAQGHGLRKNCSPGGPTHFSRHVTSTR